MESGTMAMSKDEEPVIKRVLSIQSHVVHGYVGNRAATFPLQYRGWDVDSLNTVNFSNHPGYGKFTGVRTTSTEIEDIYRGLMNIGCVYDTLLTGYVADASSLDIVGQVCKDYIENHNSDCIWVLDPVLGDNGKLYVSKEVIPIYEEMLKTGNVKLVTPNQFEMEVLTDTKINSLSDLKKSILKFHSIYDVPNVVITSVYLDKVIYCAGSTQGNEPFYFKLPVIDASFSGSGDLFSALLMDRFYKYHNELDGLIKSLGETLTTVEKVLKISFAETVKQLGEQKLGDKIYVKDLKLIQSKSILLEEDLLYDVYLKW